MSKANQEKSNNQGAGKKQPNQTPKAEEEKETLGNDYWNRIADDVASGYEGKHDKDDILNDDQEADDHIRGDAAS